jgi:putative SOS response-associated peptidase YedK
MKNADPRSSLSNLPTYLRKEIEQFFLSTTFFTAKNSKILGWKGPKRNQSALTRDIAPSQKVLTIRFNPETQARSLDALQWGLIPYWESYTSRAK